MALRKAPLGQTFYEFEILPRQWLNKEEVLFFLFIFFFFTDSVVYRFIHNQSSVLCLHHHSRKCTILWWENPWQRIINIFRQLQFPGQFWRSWYPSGKILRNSPGYKEFITFSLKFSGHWFSKALWHSTWEKNDTIF